MHRSLLIFCRCDCSLLCPPDSAAQRLFDRLNLVRIDPAALTIHTGMFHRSTRRCLRASGTVPMHSVLGLSLGLKQLSTPEAALSARPPLTPCSPCRASCQPSSDTTSSSSRMTPTPPTTTTSTPSPSRSCPYAKRISYACPREYHNSTAKSDLSCCARRYVSLLPAASH